MPHCCLRKQNPTLIGCLPYVISNSGHYQLAKSLLYTGEDAAVSVEANQVLLDLCGFSLSHDGNPTGESVGIEVTNSNDVYITNGTVKDMKAYGMKVSNSSNITLDTLNLFHNGDLNKFAYLSGGLYLNTVEALKVSNVIALENKGSGLHLHGRKIGIEPTEFGSKIKDAEFVDCRFSRTTESRSPFSSTRYASIGCFGDNIALQNVSFVRTKFNSQKFIEVDPSFQQGCVGAWLNIYRTDDNDNISFIECETSDMKAPASGGDTEVRGLNIFSQNINVGGASTENATNVLIDRHISANIETDLGSAAGINLFGISNATIKDCVVTTVRGRQAWGIGADGKTDNINVQNCNVSKIISYRQDRVTPALGIRITNQINNSPSNNPVLRNSENITVTNCVVMECYNPNTPGVGYGIAVAPRQNALTGPVATGPAGGAFVNNVLISNCRSSRNDGAGFAVVKDDDNGFPNVKGIVMQNNQSFNNGIGFLDKTQTDSLNLYKDNTAWDNGVAYNIGGQASESNYP